MNLTLWIIAGVLGAAFVFAGMNKVVIPREKLLKAPGGGWAESFTPAKLRALGVVEVLGGIGLVVPWATGIAPVLTPIAAVGLAVIMIGAVITMAKRGEYKHMALNVLYLALLATVAVGRF